jgi:hypothetical protein
MTIVVLFSVVCGKFSFPNKPILLEKNLLHLLISEIIVQQLKTQIATVWGQGQHLPPKN